MSPAEHVPSPDPGGPPVDVVVDATSGASVPGERVGGGLDAPALPGLRFLPAQVQRLVTTMLPVIDQGVSSASNFVVTIGFSLLLAGTSDLFVAVMAYNILLVVQGCLRTGLYHRLVSLPAGSVDDVVPSALRLVLVAATIGGLVAAAVYLLVGGIAAGAIVLGALGVLLLQDGLRFASLVYRRDVDALVTDGTWFVAVVVIVGVLALVVDHLTAAWIAGAWVAGAVASLVVLLVQPRYRPRSATPVGTAVGVRTALGGVGDFLIPASITFGLPVVAALCYGTEGGGALPGALTYFALCSAFLQGLPAPVLRHLVDVDPGRHRAVQLRLVAVIGGAIAAVLAGMFAIRGVLHPLLINEETWPQIRGVLLPTGLFVLARFVEIPAYAMGRVTDRLDGVVRLRALGSAATFVAFVVPRLLGRPLTTAFWSFAITSAAAALVAVAVDWTKPRRILGA